MSSKEIDFEKQMWRLENYKAYGLNVHRNFVEFKDEVYIDPDDFDEYLEELLDECECDNPAVFCHRLNGEVYMACTEDCDDENGLLFSYYMSEYKNDVDFFADMDGEYRFCCYTLMVEAEPNVWRFVQK